MVMLEWSRRGTAETLSAGTGPFGPVPWVGNIFRTASICWNGASGRRPRVAYSSFEPFSYCTAKAFSFGLLDREAKLHNPPGDRQVHGCKAWPGLDRGAIRDQFWTLRRPVQRGNATRL